MRLLLLCLTLSLAACAATKPVIQGQAIMLTEQDNNKAVHLIIGQSFAIHLNENPTTGYVWEVDGKPELIILQNSDYVASSHSKGLVGGGGQHSFTFMAQKTGTTTLKLKQWRPWLGDSSIVETFNVDLQIETK